MSKLKETLKKDLTSAIVEKKGQKAYKRGKLLMFIGLCGIALLLLICIASSALGGNFEDPLFFDIYDDYAFVYPLIAVAYLAILGGFYGICSYNIGIYLFTFGRIAVNTEKTETKATNEDELPEL